MRRLPTAGRVARLWHERGIALLTALLVVAIATATAVAFALRDRVEIYRAELLQAQTQAESLARAGESLTLRLLERTRDLSELPWNDQCRTPWIPFEVDGLMVAARLENLHCRFNVNALSATNDEQRERAVAVFAELIEAAAREAPNRAASAASAAGGPQTGRPSLRVTGPARDDGGVLAGVNGRLLANAVVDWMNPETDDPRYRLDDPPRRSGNRRMVLAAELNRVEGFGPELLERLAPYVTARPGGDFYIDRDWAPDIVLRAVDAGGGAAGEGRVRYLRLEQRINVYDREFRFCAVLDGPNGRRVLRVAGPCER
ncbi:MAG: general secretion pathway protein GspK [Thioalkalivibrionaceae bacterium]